MSSLLIRLWKKVREPRVISFTYFVSYMVLFGVAVSALVDPPRSVEGHIGALAMTLLAAILAFGAAIGAPSALMGVWWLERVAVFAIAVAALIYGGIVIGLHIDGSGNRLLQFGFVINVLLMQIVRWYRIKDEDLDPDRPLIAQ